MIPFALIFLAFGIAALTVLAIKLFHLFAGLRETLKKFEELEAKVDQMQDTLETILLGDLTKAEISEAIRRGFDSTRRRAEQAVRR